MAASQSRRAALLTAPPVLMRRYLFDGVLAAKRLIMIHWLLQSRNNHPDLAVGNPPTGLLSRQEMAVFSRLKTEKRKRDWLLGRWTAKHLIQAVVAQQEGSPTIPFNTFSVLAGEDGAPLIHSSQPAVESKWTISISHAGGNAFCALVERPYWPLGADIERIEQRSSQFVADYFTAEEQTLVYQAQPDEQAEVVTAVWSAKEAALKAIHQGLKVDTRCVACLIQPQTDNPSDWAAFEIKWDSQRIPDGPPLTGWRRRWDEFVLTMAVQPD